MRTRRPVLGRNAFGRKLIAAIRAGVTYVNVHTTANSGGVPGGEIRGQIK